MKKYILSLCFILGFINLNVLGQVSNSYDFNIDYDYSGETPVSNLFTRTCDYLNYITLRAIIDKKENKNYFDDFWFNYIVDYNSKNDIKIFILKGKEIYYKDGSLYDKLIKIDNMLNNNNNNKYLLKSFNIEQKKLKLREESNLLCESYKTMLNEFISYFTKETLNNNTEYEVLITYYETVKCKSLDKFGKIINKSCKCESISSSEGNQDIEEENTAETTVTEEGDQDIEEDNTAETTVTEEGDQDIEEENTTEVTVTEEGNHDIEEDNTTKTTIAKEGDQFEVIILYLALGLATLGLIFWIISFITNYRNSKKRTPHQNTLDYLEKKTFPHYDKALDEINNRIKFIVNELDGLQKSLGIYNDRLNNLKEEMSDKTVVQESFVDRQKEVVPKIARKYYLPFPDKQGFFWDDKKSDIPSSSSVFILEFDENNNQRGTFTLDLRNEKNIKTALSSPSSFLKPVCEIVNDNFYGKSIEVVEKGILQLHENRWVIDDGKKLKIKIN